MRKRLPKHMKRKYGTLRRFRAIKRDEARQVMAGLARLRRGCAHTPAHKQIVIACNAASRTLDLLSEVNWGRGERSA